MRFPYDGTYPSPPRPEAAKRAERGRKWNSEKAMKMASIPLPRFSGHGRKSRGRKLKPFHPPQCEPARWGGQFLDRGRQSDAKQPLEGDRVRGDNAPASRRSYELPERDIRTLAAPIPEEERIKVSSYLLEQKRKRIKPKSR